jgi:hypothetical protein
MPADNVPKVPACRYPLTAATSISFKWRAKEEIESIGALSVDRISLRAQRAGAIGDDSAAEGKLRRCRRP